MTLEIQTTPREREKLITGEEFHAMGDIGPAELVRGEIVRMSPPGHLHGLIEGNLHYELSRFNREHKLGRVLVGETGVYTARDPDTIRGMDVAFISNARMAQVTSTGYLVLGAKCQISPLRRQEIQEKNLAGFAPWREVRTANYLDVAPELIVEILSPGDLWSDVMDKLAEYFAIGVMMVWVADPRLKRVYAYRSLTESEIFDGEDELTGGEVLAGFSVPVAAFFAE